MQRRWIFPPARDPKQILQLSAELGVPVVVAEMLLRKGIYAPGEVDAFLNPRLKSLSDPMLLDEMQDAVERIDAALRRNERIVLYGDYDVDGVSSLAILHRVINAYGGRVDCFLPHRTEEGYGLSMAGIDRCLEDYSPGLLIAVDCGTNSVAEVNRLRAASVDVIIIDHHEPEGPRPDCVARVNPKCGGPEFRYLCSAGLAFKTAHALMKSVPLPGFDLRDVLDIVAMATLCDLVPLEAENRALVRAGLRQMERTCWPGIAALMEVASVRPPIRSADVGFRLGPRINAAGRLGTAQASLQLLLTNDPEEAAMLAGELDAQNRERQTVERAVVSDVEQWITAHYDADRDTTIVAGNRDWHTGVLGIVASRITRKHHRPTLVVGFDEQGEGRGSGRSIEGVSLVELLGKCADHLGNYGGHEMAAGLSVNEKDFSAFRANFEAAARTMVDEEMLVPRLRLDAELDLGDLGMSLIETQEMLEPFGMLNPQPVLYARAIAPTAEPRVLKEKHLRIEFPTGHRPVVAIFFNGAEKPLPPPPWDVAFHVERNEWNGRVYPQIHVLDIRASA